MNEQYAKCIPFDNKVKGRIGGNPPQIVENSIPDGYLFYATLVHGKNWRESSTDSREQYS